MNPAFKAGLEMGLSVKSVGKLAFAIATEVDPFSTAFGAYYAGMKAALKIRLANS